MAARPAFRAMLNRAYRRYDARWIDPDPVQFVWRYEDPEDREIAAVVASALAYGNVPQIKKSVGRVLGLLEEEGRGTLSTGVDRFTSSRAGRVFASVQHRFNDGRDIATLILIIREMRRRAGGVERFFAEAAEAEAPLGVRLAAFSERALAMPSGGLYSSDGVLPDRAGVRFFFPSPRAGSACKRWCLFLRWMVRRDSVDPGGWTLVRPRDLVIPLDAHVFAISRRLGLTNRNTPSWAMAEEITSSLRDCDPDDPVKYDFALHRMGLFDREGDLRALARLQSRT
jgi:uncharacterized protein (TIGR02757 family)